jgi:hypothetical protein
MAATRAGQQGSHCGVAWADATLCAELQGKAKSRTASRHTWAAMRVLRAVLAAWAIL